MKYAILLALTFVTFARGSTLTFSLSVHENAAPSRHANLFITDGSNVVSVDLFRTIDDGAIYSLAFCAGYGFTSRPCNFTPGGNLLVDNRGGSSPFSYLVLNGTTIPFTPGLLDYELRVKAYFWSFSTISTFADTPWSAPIRATNIEVSVERLSTHECLFCVNTLNATGSANGIGRSMGSYGAYDFTYQAVGDINSPESATIVLVLNGLLALLAIRSLCVSSHGVK